MKTLKSITIVITILLIATANAQITKGNWMVGGNGSFYSQRFKNQQFEQNSMVLELRPNGGYFLVNNFAIGISPQFTYVNTKEFEGPATISYGSGLFVRYYLLKSTKKVNILTHIGYTLSTSSNEDSTNEMVDLKAGPVFFLNPKVALEITLNYNYNNLSATTTVNVVSLGVGFQIHLEKLVKNKKQ